jgi:hypothetical protein
MVERSCVNVSGLCVEHLVLRATMGISAHSFSLPDRPQRAEWVTRSRMRRQTLFHLSIRLADLGGILLLLVLDQPNTVRP